MDYKYTLCALKGFSTVTFHFSLFSKFKYHANRADVCLWSLFCEIGDRCSPESLSWRRTNGYGRLLLPRQIKGQLYPVSEAFSATIYSLQLHPQKPFIHLSRILISFKWIEHKDCLIDVRTTIFRKYLFMHWPFDF